jgi:NTE family protein
LIFEKEIDSAFIIFERSVQLSIRDNTDERKKLAHIVLEPPGLSRFQIFDLNEAEAIFNIGYEYAKSKVTEIEKIALSTS